MLSAESLRTLQGCWDVFLLFLIPVGGGIPAGVLLAQKQSIFWPGMMALYFLSDLVLACVFDPLMLIFIAASKRSVALARLAQAFRESTRKTVPLYGTRMGPLALILISFGVDPMTGRVATAAAGHGFFSGWMLAIIGDMGYFSLIMISTLWLNNLLGDGTATTVIIMLAMFVVPHLIRRLRAKKDQEK